MTQNFLALFSLTYLLLTGTVSAPAEIRLPAILSDHAVLQRDVPIHVWGWATPGTHITVLLNGQSQPAIVDEFGEWSAYLAPERAGGPYSLMVEGDGKVERDDLMIGDVWLASGQSNMEFPLQGFTGAPLRDSAKEIAAANNPKLRLLLVPRRGADFSQNDQGGTWTACTPQTVAFFSAVAYFFGREIAEKENVTIGVIDTTWGGTPADSWVSMETLGGNAALTPVFQSRALFAAGENRREELAMLERKATEHVRGSMPPPKHSWRPNQTSWLPSGLFNGMIAPLAPYSLKGFLWYQGETNSRQDRYANYAVLFPALIADWRMHFAQGDLPFLYAQISSFGSVGEHWGIIRDAQRQALSIRQTSMTVTIDVGELHNVHPADKQTVGHRMALAAEGMVYGLPVAYRSPTFRQVTNEPDALRVWFDDADGLVSHSKAITGFELAGIDHKFITADAYIDGSTVRISSEKITNPAFVRYAWKNDDLGSLWNGAGLPVGTFTSESAPVE